MKVYLVALFMNFVAADIALSAELLQKNSKKAILKLTEDESDFFDEGDRIKLISSEGYELSLKVFQIDGRRATVIGKDVRRLSEEDVYEIEMNEPSSSDSKKGLLPQSSTAPLSPGYLSLGYGRRWIKDSVDEASSTLKIGYLFEPLPIGVGLEVLFLSALDKSYEGITEIKKSSYEFSGRFEFTKRFGVIRPFVAARYLIAGEAEGSMDFNDRSTGVSGGAEAKAKMNPEITADYGIEFYLSPKFAIFVSGQKKAKASETDQIKIHLKNPYTGDVETYEESSSKSKSSYDSLTVGITLFGFSN